MNNHVTNLELSRQLKEIGCPQDNSTFYWSNWDGGNDKGNPGIILRDDANLGFMEDLFSAYLLSELWQFLPFPLISLTSYTGGFGIKYIPEISSSQEIREWGSTPIEAMGNLILKLHSDKLLTFEK